MSLNDANLRRSFRDLEEDLERACAGLRLTACTDLAQDEIKWAFEDFSWEVRQALKAFKQQVLASEAAP